MAEQYISAVENQKQSEGKTYRLHIRGFSFPLFGIYPYIVDAKEE